MMKMITHHLHQGARKWEKEKETTKNGIQRRKPFPSITSSCLDNFFLSPNQNLESTTDWYRDVGKDYVKDIDGNVNVCLAYAYDTPPSRVGKENQFFFLTSMATLVTKKVDILHHAQASLEGKPLLLKRSIQASDCLRHRPNASQYHILV
jgi:hypothetical protein